MPSPAEAGTNTVELGKRHITDQSLRIQRMEQSLARMKADYSVARERSAIRRLFDLR
jgi:hypothetical protein